MLLTGAAKRSDEQIVGRTGTFKAVIVAKHDHVPGDFVDVRIERSTSASLFGTVVCRD